MFVKDTAEPFPCPPRQLSVCDWHSDSGSYRFGPYTIVLCDGFWKGTVEYLFDGYENTIDIISGCYSADEVLDTMWKWCEMANRNRGGSL